jgi:hypothetical protein
MIRVVIFFTALAVEVALICRDQLLIASLLGFGVVLVIAVAIPVAREMRDIWVAERARLRDLCKPEPPHPLPDLEQVPRLRVRREPHPPWDTATMPVIPVQADGDGPYVATHQKERGLRDALMAALTAAARVGLKD